MFVKSDYVGSKVISCWASSMSASTWSARRAWTRERRWCNYNSQVLSNFSTWYTKNKLGVTDLVLFSECIVERFDCVHIQSYSVCYYHIMQSIIFRRWLTLKKSKLYSSYNFSFNVRSLWWYLTLAELMSCLACLWNKWSTLSTSWLGSATASCWGVVIPTRANCLARPWCTPDTSMSEASSRWEEWVSFLVMAGSSKCRDQSSGSSWESRGCLSNRIVLYWLKYT